MATGTRRRSGTRGFTLIELLVVVAIIALLISILLPSLARAREQARTSECLSRIKQYINSFLMYAEDYDEGFPFIMQSPSDNDGPDPNENWLASGDDIVEIARKPEEDWAEWVDVPRSGTLFLYARFPKLYRCPEFERIDHPDKTHNVFNYTRGIWARYWTLWIERFNQGQGGSEWGDVDGPIMKVAMVHNPAACPLILDEQWDRFVATAGFLGEDGEGYNCNDCMFGEHGIIGMYHGRPTVSRFHDWDIDTRHNYYDPFIWKRGAVACYDGHAELQRDPWPTFVLGNNKRSDPPQWRLNGRERRAFEEINAIQSYMEMLIYAQRGFSATERFAKPPPPWGR